MIDIGKLRTACSGLRRSKRRCVFVPEEGGESSGDYRRGRGWVWLNRRGEGVYARGAGQRYRCSIAYACAVADLMSQSPAQARPRPRPRLAHKPAAAAAACTCHVVGVHAEGACTAAATVLQVEREPTAQGRRYFVGAADPETVVSVRSDQGRDSDSEGQTLTAMCARLRCTGGSGAIGWRGIGSVWASMYTSSSSSSGGGPMLGCIRGG